jgi:extradiol dioxygenase
MLEVRSIDDVGAALDIVNEREIPLAMSLGRHTNDHMTSFYVRTPSGFEIEYGTGGRLVDDDTWTIDRYDATSTWGHKPPATGPLPPGIIRPFEPAKISN